MTKSVIVQTELADSEEAGRSLGKQISKAFDAEIPDAVILFASPVFDYPLLLKSLMEECAPAILAGCSPAGEFSGDTPSGSSACGVAIRSSDLGFGVGVGRGIAHDRAAAAREMVGIFRSTSCAQYHFRSALLLTDALAGYTEELLPELCTRTADRVKPETPRTIW